MAGTTVTGPKKGPEKPPGILKRGVNQAARPFRAIGKWRRERRDRKQDADGYAQEAGRQRAIDQANARRAEADARREAGGQIGPGGEEISVGAKLDEFNDDFRDVLKRVKTSLIRTVVRRTEFIEVVEKPQKVKPPVETPLEASWSRYREDNIEMWDDERDDYIEPRKELAEKLRRGDLGKLDVHELEIIIVTAVGYKGLWLRESEHGQLREEVKSVKEGLTDKEKNRLKEIETELASQPPDSERERLKEEARLLREKDKNKFTEEEEKELEDIKKELKSSKLSSTRREELEEEAILLQGLKDRLEELEQRVASSRPWPEDIPTPDEAFFSDLEIAAKQKQFGQEGEYIGSVLQDMANVPTLVKKTDAPKPERSIIDLNLVGDYLRQKTEEERTDALGKFGQLVTYMLLTPKNDIFTTESCPGLEVTGLGYQEGSKGEFKEKKRALEEAARELREAPEGTPAKAAARKKYAEAKKEFAPFLPVDEEAERIQGRLERMLNECTSDGEWKQLLGDGEDNKKRWAENEELTKLLDKAKKLVGQRDKLEETKRTSKSEAAGASRAAKAWEAIDEYYEKEYAQLAQEVDELRDEVEKADLPPEIKEALNGKKVKVSPEDEEGSEEEKVEGILDLIKDKRTLKERIESRIDALGDKYKNPLETVARYVLRQLDERKTEEIPTSQFIIARNKYGKVGKAEEPKRGGTGRTYKWAQRIYKLITGEYIRPALKWFYKHSGLQSFWGNLTHFFDHVRRDRPKRLKDGTFSLYYPFWRRGYTAIFQALGKYAGLTFVFGYLGCSTCIPRYYNHDEYVIGHSRHRSAWGNFWGHYGRNPFNLETLGGLRPAPHYTRYITKYYGVPEELMGRPNKFYEDLFGLTNDLNIEWLKDKPEVLRYLWETRMLEEVEYNAATDEKVPGTMSCSTKTRYIPETCENLGIKDAEDVEKYHGRLGEVEDPDDGWEKGLGQGDDRYITKAEAKKASKRRQKGRKKEEACSADADCDKNKKCSDGVCVDKSQHKVGKTGDKESDDIKVPKRWDTSNPRKYGVCCLTFPYIRKFTENDADRLTPLNTITPGRTDAFISDLRQKEEEMKKFNEDDEITYHYLVENRTAWLENGYILEPTMQKVMDQEGIHGLDNAKRLLASGLLRSMVKPYFRPGEARWAVKKEHRDAFLNELDRLITERYQQLKLGKIDTTKSSPKAKVLKEVFSRTPESKEGKACPPKADKNAEVIRTIGKARELLGEREALTDALLGLVEKGEGIAELEPIKDRAKKLYREMATDYKKKVEQLKEKVNEAELPDDTKKELVRLLEGVERIPPPPPKSQPTQPGEEQKPKEAPASLNPSAKKEAPDVVAAIDGYDAALKQLREKAEKLKQGLKESGVPTKTKTVLGDVLQTIEKIEERPPVKETLMEIAHRKGEGEDGWLEPTEDKFELAKCKDNLEPLGLEITKTDKAEGKEEEKAAARKIYIDQKDVRELLNKFLDPALKRRNGRWLDTTRTVEFVTAVENHRKEKVGKAKKEDKERVSREAVSDYDPFTDPPGKNVEGMINRGIIITQPPEEKTPAASSGGGLGVTLSKRTEEFWADKRHERVVKFVDRALPLFFEDKGPVPDLMKKAFGGERATTTIVIKNGLVDLFYDTSQGTRESLKADGFEVGGLEELPTGETSPLRTDLVSASLAKRGLGNIIERLLKEQEDTQ